MPTRKEQRSKRRFDQQKMQRPRPGVVSDMCAMQDAGLAHLAWMRADAWARSPEGTPYGAVEPAGKATDGDQ